MKRLFLRLLLASVALSILASVAWPQVPGSTTGDVTDPSQADPSSIPTTLVRNADDPLRRAPATPMAGPVDPKTYHLGPGDVLHLQAWGRLSRSWYLEIGPEGYVSLPGSGSVRVEGRTLTDVRADVLSRLERQFRGVSIDLRLSRPRIFRVFLTGHVRSPGSLQATGANRLAEVLSDVLLLENSSRRRIEILHLDGSREIADLELFLRTGRQDMNPWMRDGDVITVPVATDFVWAHGALGRPGRFELGLHDSLRTLLELAGDPIPAAAVEGALFLRWKDSFTPESLWVRLDQVYNRQVNPSLREGDRVYVYYLPQYHLQHEAYIQGEVSRPGVYPIVEGRHHLSDLLGAAGGFLPTADLTSIRVHRRNPSAGDKDPELDRLLRLSREQLTTSEYDKLTTKLASLREDYLVDWTRLSETREQIDLLLRDGDIVRLERLVSSIRIDGEVSRPGILSYRSGFRVADYVRQAGGFTDRAWKGRIRVTRAVTGQTLPARNVKTLDPGDFVWVPEKLDKTLWDHARETLTALAQVATVIIAIRTLN